MGNAPSSKGGDRGSPDFSNHHSNNVTGLSPVPVDFETGGKRKVLLSQPSTDPDEDSDTKGIPIPGGGVRIRTRTIVEGTNLKEDALPTVFKWEGGGKEVFIKGTFSDWKPIKMCHSHGDFVAILDVPEGIHSYKFIVDGNETINTSSEKDAKDDHNIINVKKSDFEVFEALAQDLASNPGNSNNNTIPNGSPPGEYTQELPDHLKPRTDGSMSPPLPPVSGSGPPILPPHLLQGGKDLLQAPLIVTSRGGNTNQIVQSILPQPNHVMLNHLYALSIKDGVMVLSCTHRYRKKYVTTLLYKPI